MRYKCTGYGAFPMEMLRYDSFLVADTPSDKAKMKKSQQPDQEDGFFIVYVRHSDRATRYAEPTYRKWLSFGVRIVPEPNR